MASRVHAEEFTSLKPMVENLKPLFFSGVTRRCVSSMSRSALHRLTFRPLFLPVQSVAYTYTIQPAAREHDRLHDRLHERPYLYGAPLGKARHRLVSFHLACFVLRAVCVLAFAGVCWALRSQISRVEY